MRLPRLPGSSEVRRSGGGGRKEQPWRRWRRSHGLAEDRDRGGRGGRGRETYEHWGLEGPFPAQELPFELEGAKEFEHICANRKVGDITERI